MELSRNLITSHWLSYQLHDLIPPWLKTWHQRKIQAAFNMQTHGALAGARDQLFLNGLPYRGVALLVNPYLQPYYDRVYLKV